MKLRLRNLETKETLRLEIPSSPCTLQQLQQTLSQSISPPPPPPPPPPSSSSSSSSLHFSLNRKDALHASSPHDSLHSLGITSGDLIYFSLNPSAFSPPPQTLIPQIPNSNPKSESVIFQESHVLGPNQETLLQESQVLANQETPVQDLIDSTNLDSNIQIQGNKETSVQDNMVDTNQETEDTQDLSGTETMDIDDGTMDVAGKKFSEPCFLRRVLREELGDDGSDHKLLVVAVHSVLLESGFVGFDSVSGLRVDRFHLPDEWPSTAFTVSLWYTLPELLGKETESVVLKFRTLGRFVNVYGCLAKGGSSLYRVCLDEDRFVPTIDVVWANCDKNDKMDDKDGSSSLYPENEVFEFWKIVKDGLALPLLIDLCDRTGLVLPPCLMRLPTELKVKILESLPAVDVAKMGCVCSEMRYLSSNNDLWKQKFAEEFGGEMGVQGMIPWKDKFTYSWECRKKRKRMMSRQWQERVGRPFYFPIRRDPLGWPVIGGDYDRLPGLGIPSLFGQPGRAFPRRNFLPPCNLGGLNI